MSSVQHSLTLFLLFSFILCTVQSSLSVAGTKNTPKDDPLATSATGVSMRVLWTILDFHRGSYAALSEKEARTMLFKPLDMTTSSIVFDGQSCDDILFEKETVETKIYLQERFQVSPQTLGLEQETVQIIKTNCPMTGFSEFLRLQDRRLIVPIHGVLFVFEPALNY